MVVNVGLMTATTRRGRALCTRCLAGGSPA